MQAPQKRNQRRTDQQLAIYLNDHRAGAEGAEALARRSARSNADNMVGDYLGNEFLPELLDDRALLEALRKRFEVRSNPAKQIVARIAEFVGRAKLNGALAGPTPLGRVLELEALISGVNGKRQLWRTFAALKADDPDLFEQRLARAHEQLVRLEALHRWATLQAFGGSNDSGGPPPDVSNPEPPSPVSNQNNREH